MVTQITKDPRTVPVRMGLAFLLIGPPITIGAPVAVTIIKHQHGDFWGLQVFTGVFMFAAAVLYVVARVVVGGWKVSTKV